MGLTLSSSGLNLLRQNFNLDPNRNNPLIALAGNPNTGKSTVFNGLTGLKQHTGNWPGKTVTQAQGYFQHQGKEYTLVDLPGTYSLLANSEEERIARDFICFARPEATIVVADATHLERNLNLVLQVTELRNKVVLCLNLMDEAAHKGIEIDLEGLRQALQIPVVPTVAREGKGLKELKDVVADLIAGKIQLKPLQIPYSPEVEKAIAQILPELQAHLGQMADLINLRWLALRLIEGDQTIIESIQEYFLKPNLNGKILTEFKEVQSHEGIYS